MRTVYLNNSNTLYIELADVVRAFGGDVVALHDDSEQAHRATIGANGVELVAFFYNGVARLSLLPLLRQQFNLAQFANVPSCSGDTLSTVLNLNIGVFNAAGGVLNTVTTITAAALYVAAPLTAVYGGVRHIMFNPSFPDTQYLTFLACHTNAVVFESSALATPVNITGQNGITRANIGLFFADNPTNVVIRTSQAEVLRGNDIVNNEILKINVTIDWRTENVVFLRWLDNTGLQHYRTFSMGGRTTTAVTEGNYTPARLVNVLSDYSNDITPIADKKTTKTVTFGDDAINEKYLPEIVSLIDAPKVEFYDTLAGAWLRVVLGDTSITEKKKEHTFNFNAVATMPQLDNIQW